MRRGGASFSIVMGWDETGNGRVGSECWSGFICAEGTERQTHAFGFISV